MSSPDADEDLLGPDPKAMRVELGIDAILGGDIRRVMGYVFARAEVCDEEIAAAGFTHAQVPSATYTALRAPPQFDKVEAAWVYRRHVRELLTRLREAKGKPRVELLIPGTKAEVLVGLIHAAGAAPLNASGQGLAEKLWRELAPPEVATQALGELPPGREKWDGHLDEALDKARQGCKAEWRRLP